MPKQFLSLVFFVTLFLSPATWALMGTGLEFSVAADMVYRQSLEGEHEGNEKLTMRAAELMFYGPIDHRFDGVLSLAAHDEGGETLFELHEAYLESSRIIPRSEIKVGQFFLGIGRLNPIHQHDWSFTNTPRVIRDFLDKEGVFDAGVEYSYIFDTDYYLNLTVGLTSGHRFGHAHTSGQKPKMPTHYSRLSHFIDLGGPNGMEVGLNYLGRTDGNRDRQQLWGLDYVAKWREGRVLKWQIESEWWYRNTEKRTGEREEAFGGYVFTEYGLDPIWSFGLRGDMFKDLTMRDAISLEKENHIFYGFGPSVTYRNSEFSWFRATFFHEFDRVEGQTHNRDTRFELQFVFILGAHPAHAF